MIYILAAVLVFGVLIAVHELGHFLAARICGVRVNEYSIGMGPAIWKKQKGETLYALRVFPMGGYCAMEGEEEDSDDPAALNNQGFWTKLFIYAAGAFMNFLTGFVIVLLLYAGAERFYVPTIVDFQPDCPLQSETGLQIGDRLRSIDGERIYTYSDIGLLLSNNKTGVFDLVVERNGSEIHLDNFFMEKREYPSLNGGTYLGYGMSFGSEKATVSGRISHAWLTTVDFVRLVRMSLQMLVNGDAGMKDLSGPVGIVSTMTQVGEQAENTRDAVDNIAYLAAMIAVNLAVMNLLPLPALDGGKIFFLVLNVIGMRLLHRQIPAKYEGYIHFAGLVLLLGLMVIITFQDVWKLFT